MIAAVKQGDPPDIVLLDVMMPGMNGLETLKAIKTAKSDLQVIMLSGREQASTIVEAVRLGAADYVVKPDDPEGLGEIALDSAIKSAVEKTRLVSEMAGMKATRQRTLLPVLQEPQLTKLGSNKSSTVDVRVVAATNRDLEAMLARGDFREDLYYRLKVIEVTVPPLRERRNEISHLATFFMDRYARRYNRPARPLSDELQQLFQRYEWP